MARSSDTTHDQAASAFNQGVDHTLKLLHGLVPLDAWMLTRVEANEQIVVRAEDHAYGIEPGTTFAWSHSFCIRMLSGQGPHIAPDTRQVPAYREALAAQPEPIAIGSYIGYPIHDQNQGMYGVLCAMHPEPLPTSIEERADDIESAVRVIESLLAQRRQLDELEREQEALRLEAYSDALTSAYNRRGWQLVLAAEEQRCESHSLPAGIIAIDLDHLKTVNDEQGHAAGDQLIATAAQALLAALRERDLLARLGGDEFAVLLPDTPADHLPEIAERLSCAMEGAGVAASIGFACRTVNGSLLAAQTSADEAMYQNKRRRRATTRPRDHGA
ncbi:diguanylate cyclase [Thioalkalivibrio sp. ALJ16]|uniref:sensor domain-containing diguanylate cyclase n=1 Tax=Thioalkalivibrio sp. ALJ16 TaxID=1158762 RepID=UPI000375719D|nr:diguanylate cyclase [Thioalkalivibrio sp. ALJ16]